MNNPFFSILIPTRERCETLGAALKTCTQQTYENCEFIVSDNCSTDQTLEVARSIDDKRIRYINPGQRLSMTANFEFALSHAEGRFIASIGDDDGLMPGALEKVAEIIRQTGTAAVASSTVSYIWPNYPIDNQKNTIRIRDIRRGFETINSKTELTERIRFDGSQIRYADRLPGIYRGFASSDIVRKAMVDGKYFHSITPDAYSAIVNALHLANHVYSREPLFIDGTSGRSNGAAQMTKNVGQDEAQRYNSENDLQFHPALAFIPSISIILAEAFLQARDKNPELASRLSVDLSRVLGAALSEKQLASRAQVVQVVEEIAARHQIMPKEPSVLENSRQVLRRIGAGLQMFEVRVDESQVSDVYQASVYAANVLHNMSRSKGQSVLYLLTHVMKKRADEKRIAARAA